MSLRTWGLIAAVVVIVALLYAMFAEGDLDSGDRSGPPEATQQIEN